MGVMGGRSNNRKEARENGKKYEIDLHLLQGENEGHRWRHRRYLDVCELEVLEPRYTDDFILKLLYEIINKRTSRRVKLPEGVFDMTTAAHGIYEE